MKGHGVGVVEACSHLRASGVGEPKLQHGPTESGRLLQALVVPCLAFPNKRVEVEVEYVSLATHDHGRPCRVLTLLQIKKELATRASAVAPLQGGLVRLCNERTVQ